MKKKTLIIVMFLITLHHFSFTKKAHAGVVIGTYGVYCTRTVLEALNAGGLGVATILVSSIAGSLITFSSPSLGTKIILAGIVLDKNSDHQLSHFLNLKFPFINNETIVNELANHIEQKIDINSNYLTTIHLEPNEIKNIFIGSDLSEEQVEQITKELE